jgi:hypothetical protein
MGLRSTTKSLNSPQGGVLCDKHMCVDASGISKTLTEKFLGGAAAIKTVVSGRFRPDAISHLWTVSSAIRGKEPVMQTDISMSTASEAP